MAQIFTPKEFENYLRTLPKELVKAKDSIVEEMARELEKMIVMRAPEGRSKWASHSLVRDIRAVKGKEGWEIVGPAHWFVVNEGLTPRADKIPVDMMIAHKAFPGSTVGQKANIPKGESVPFAKTVRKMPGKGFVDRAVKAFEVKISTTVNRGIRKALE